MNSWWQLAEGSGYPGTELPIYQITCAFCLERGNFSIEHAAVKKNPESEKALRFDTLKCGNCAGYVLVLWSLNRSGDLYDYRVLPWPLRLDKHPEHWPKDVGRYWLQAHRNARDENWDASAVMTRSALQIALRQHDAKGKNLKQEIDDLATKGVLPPHMKEWAHELRDLGNDSAHPALSADPPTPQDVRDVLKFLDFLLEYLYTLPHQIDQYRKRKPDA